MKPWLVLKIQANINAENNFRHFKNETIKDSKWGKLEQYKLTGSSGSPNASGVHCGRYFSKTVSASSSFYQKTIILIPKLKLVSTNSFLEMIQNTLLEKQTRASRWPLALVMNVRTRVGACNQRCLHTNFTGEDLSCVDEWISRKVTSGQ